MIQHRALNIDHIRKAIREPDLREDAGGGRVKVLKKFEDGRKIRVVYSKDGAIRNITDYLVITVYYL